MTESTDRAQTVFLNALEITSDEVREAYIDAECRGNEALRREVCGLLEHAQRLGGFLENDNPPVSAFDPTIESIFTDRIGTQIGPYKIRETLAEGGMGVVYVAEQTEPVRRKVALKIIKPGMATKDVVARFEAERQALAVMEHPNIAQVFDGGATDAGYPFFVMELIQGFPITEYCDQRRLSNRERLQLFMQVCRAVQHAHQKGIIHRDIKPTNVLVAQIDGAAVPKVIDFGVAKAVGQKLTDQTVYTKFSQLIGTPLYMSPEQVEMGVLDIDTRSDIYSLGVLLYELLTGSTPFDRETLRNAAFDELRRIVREEEPRRPSAAVSTLQAQALSTVATHRQTDPRKLCDGLKGELDWLVMKALEKDRNRRYESASDFATDVQRYLDNEPVAACPPSVIYRLQKFARRNKAALATLGIVVVTLLLGIVGTSWQAWRATAERDEKQAALAQSEANWELARQAVDDMYSRVAVEWLEDQPHLTKLQEELLLKAADFYERIPVSNSQDAAVLYESANAKFRAGRVLNALSESARALTLLQQSLDTYDQLRGQAPQDIEYAVATATAMHELGNALAAERRHEDARHTLNRTLVLIGQILANHRDNKAARIEQATIHHSLANLYPLPRLFELVKSNDEIKERRGYLLEAIRLSEELVKDFPDDPRCQLGYVESIGELAISTVESPEKEELLRKAVQTASTMVADYPMNAAARNILGRCQNHLANVLIGRNQIDQSLQLLRESQGQLRTLMNNCPDVPAYRNSLVTQYNVLVATLIKAERWEEAEVAGQEAVSLCTQLPASLDKALFRENMARALERLARVQTQLNKLDSALESFNKSLELHPWCVFCLSSRGLLHEKLGNKDEALADLEKVVEPAPSEIVPHNQLGVFYWHQRRFEAAEQAFAKIIELDPTGSMGYGNRGETLLYMGRYDEALVDLTQGLDRSPKDPYVNSSMAWLLVAGPREIRDPQEAVVMAENGLVLENKKLKILGGAWFRLGQHAQAKNALTDAVQLTDESSLEQLGESLLFLAMACHKLGDHEEANERFSQAETWIKENAGPEDVHLQTIRKEAAALLTDKERQTPLTNESNSTGKKP